jgi:hypothetical protein
LIKITRNLLNVYCRPGILYKDNTEKKPVFTRDQVVTLLVNRFTNDYRDAIIHYELPEKLELTEHLSFALDLIFIHAHTNNENIYSYYLELEDELLRKYRKAFKPYLVQQFFRYFWFDEVLIEKGIYTQEAFYNLEPEWQRLSVEEITDFVERCRDFLNYTRVLIYLKMEPESAGVQQISLTAPAMTEQPEQNKDITKARQLLTIYYLLKAGWEIEPRSSHPVSAIVRFAHLLTGTKFSNLQNSDLYKKYTQMPHYKTGEQLIADLKFIRSYFEELHIEKAVQLIDEEIQQTVKELPLTIRKKYRE